MLKISSPHQPARKPRIVIVGAGFGGLSVIKGLGSVDAEITLIDRQNHHLFQPLLYQVATAALSPADIAAPIRSIVRRHRHMHVLLDSVCGIDRGRRMVRLQSGATVDYDILVIATGAQHSYFGNDHWAEFAPGIKTIDDATRVRRKILLALESAETNRQENVAERKEFLTFVIIGGGPTGVEMAGAIAELTRHATAMEFRYITPKCVRIVLIEAGSRLLASFPEDLADSARRSLEMLGVEVRLGGRVNHIDATGVIVGDDRIKAATVIWAAGVQASPAAQWLEATADKAGRVCVEPDMSVTGHPEIFVIGDTSAIARDDGRPVPGIAPAAKQQGLHVGRTIAARLAGRHEPGRFRYRDFGTLATIGRKRAVVDFGWTRLKGFSAWLLWSTAHLYFLVGFRNRFVVGMTWMWNYLTFDRGARLITGLTPGTMASPQPPVITLTPAAAPLKAVSAER
ncbi:NAD(P)/FAD-dependent oxidoreductase [Blastomonas sp. SL216]|uniref:NAD(P)/FAD-dependent oxidoreductase n=1 Tax=Blastomonas sp. SL216 TaxID=2995169 RepID=UPI0023778634|nr:NAD(P)/FAD-dependent oxidoreductase [Blastomonas sp. SL216]